MKTDIQHMLLIVFRTSKQSFLMRSNPRCLIYVAGSLTISSDQTNKPIELNSYISNL